MSKFRTLAEGKTSGWTRRRSLTTKIDKDNLDSLLVSRIQPFVACVKTNVIPISSIKSKSRNVLREFCEALDRLNCNYSETSPKYSAWHLERLLQVRCSVFNKLKVAPTGTGFFCRAWIHYGSKVFIQG